MATRGLTGDIEVELDNPNLSLHLPLDAAPSLALTGLRFDRASGRFSGTVAAPADGFVANLQLREGYVARAGQPVMSFVDTSERYLVAALSQNVVRHVEVVPEMQILALHVDQLAQALEIRADAVAVEFGRIASVEIEDEFDAVFIHVISLGNWPTARA